MDRELIEYLDRRFDQTEQMVRTEIEGVRAENRQTRVLIEDLRGQIQLVAEGVTGQQQQLDRFREEVAEEFRETRALIRLSSSSPWQKSDRAQSGSFPPARRSRVSRYHQYPCKSAP